MWSASISAAFAIGPLEGGLLTEAFGWRAVFAVDVVVAFVALPVAVRHLRESRDPAGRTVDWRGTLTLSAGLFLGVFALSRGDALGWDSAAVVGSFAGAALLLAAFAWIERRERHPMLDLGLFATPTFTGASLTVLVLAASSFGPFLYLTLFLLDAAGASPTAVGLRLMPLSAAAFLVSILGGRFPAWLPVRAGMSAGMLLSAVGLLAMRGIGVSTPWTQLLPGLLLVGAGLGLSNPAVTYAALGVVPTTRSGMASGVNNTFRQLGLAIGIAALGVLLPAQVDDAAAFAAALDDILLAGAVLATAGAVIALLLVRPRDFVA